MRVGEYISGLGLLVTAALLLPGLAEARPGGEPRSVPQGAAVRLPALRSGERYRNTFLREFDSLTPENEMKLAELQPRRGHFDFSAADELVRFARRNDKDIRGHALVWGQSLPLWLIDHGATDNLGLRLPPIVLPRLPDPLDRLLGDVTTTLTGWRRDELLTIMRHHIHTVMRHFAGDVQEWDVVNEPMASDGTLARTVWQRFIGPDYIEHALRAARKADPDAKLFINDYAVETPSRKLDGLVALARDLLARGVPLDGIGLQTHAHIADFADEATLADTMRRFEHLGLEVQVTEMDVGTSLLDVALGRRLTEQAAAYGAAARACNAVAACTRFTTWGFTDRVSWLGAGESGLLFDRDYNPKPAYEAVRSAFAPTAARTRARGSSRRPATRSSRKRAGRSFEKAARRIARTGAARKSSARRAAGR
ncbi:MAG: endo-1,4-beta-xylanase [Solirubrobacteraceae bacterium]